MQSPHGRLIGKETQEAEETRDYGQRLRDKRRKRGLINPSDIDRLVDDVAEYAAEEARRFVIDAIGMVTVGDDCSGAGVLGALERAAQECVAGIGLAAIAGVLDAVTAECPARVPCPGVVDVDDDSSGHAARLVDRRAKTMRTLLGTVEITRGYYHCRRCRRGFAVVDDVLGVAGTSLSPGLVKASAISGREMSYDKAREFIATVTGLDLASTSTLARATRSQGRMARNLIANEHAQVRPGPVASAHADGPDRCYVVMDGTGAPTLPSEVAGRVGKDGGRAGTREVKIGCFFTQTGTGPVTGEPVQDPGSVSYISTFDPAALFGAQCQQEFWRRGFDQIRQPIVLGDGAHWIWNIVGRYFPAATEIVDYFHAREHVGDLVKLLAPVIDDSVVFEQSLVDKLDIGDTDAIADIVAGLDLDESGPDLARPAATEVAYFTRNHHRMQYAEFKANGYYVGSGPVESACNTIVKQRAKRAGMHWSIDGLDPVLALRTIHQSGRDEILWTEPQT